MILVASAFRRKITLALLAGLLCALALGRPTAQPAAPDFEATPFAPRQYVAYRAPSRLTLDGKLDEPEWQQPCLARDP